MVSISIISVALGHTDYNCKNITHTWRVCEDMRRGEERRAEETPDPLHTGRFIPVIIYDAHY